MKTNIVSRIVLTLLFSLVVIAPALAGPGPHQIYTPVTTMKQAEAIKPGTRIAMQCGGCGAITTMIADKEGSYLHGYTCDVCKAKFVVRTDAHGHSRGEYICQDDAGHEAKLLQAL
jgi:hypothetical protein